jgi:hypothetical protein
MTPFFWVLPCLSPCVKSQVGVSSDWLMSFSKLQHHLELCRFAQMLFKTKFARWKLRFPSLKINKEVTFVIFFWTDGILHEVHNWEGRCCVWSLIATTSCVLALCLVLLQDLMNVSFPCCFQIPANFPKYCLHIDQFQQNVLLGLHLSSSHIIVVVRVPSCTLQGALVALLNHQFWPSTLHGVHSFLVMSFWSRTWLRAPLLVLLIHENVISTRVDVWFGLEILAPMGGCQPWHWNLRKFFSIQRTRWSSQVRRIEWWTQHDRILQGAPPSTHGRKSGVGDRESFFFQLSR